MDSGRGDAVLRFAQAGATLEWLAFQGGGCGLTLAKWFECWLFAWYHRSICCCGTWPSPLLIALRTRLPAVFMEAITACLTRRRS